MTTPVAVNHADHFYGLAALKDAGAEIWAHHRGREYLATQAEARLAQRRHYIRYLREAMERAVVEMLPFDEAYGRVDWSRYAGVAAFDAANRINAYGVYLRLERESLGR